MLKDKLLLILVLLIYNVSYHKNYVEANQNDRNEPPDKLIVAKSDTDAQRDQQSFMSNVINWILPYSISSKERSDFSSGLQYVSAAPSQSHIDCSSCNREPWIPITSKVGEKTTIHFVPTATNFEHVFNDLSVLETLHPPPVSYERPFLQDGSLLRFNKPEDTQNYNPRLQQFSSLFNKNNMAILDYMVPPPINYKVPSLIYDVPTFIYNNQPTNKPVYKLPPVNPLNGPPKYIYNPPLEQNKQYSEQMSINAFLSPPSFLNNNPKSTGSGYSQSVSPSHEYIPQLILPSVSNLPQTSYHLNEFDKAATDKHNIPSDSYGAPVTGDSLNYVLSTKQLSSYKEENEYLKKTVPLPNLSAFPLPPYRHYRNFKENLIDDQEYHNKDVQIQESINVADYLSTIEHPVNVISSPLIELSIKDDSSMENNKAYDNSDHHEFVRGYLNDNLSRVNRQHINIANRGPSPNSYLQNKINVFVRKEKAQKQYDDNIKQKLQDPQKKSVFMKLSENPIIVEDVHAAASNNNGTLVNYNEIEMQHINDKDLRNQSVHINHDFDQLEQHTDANVFKDILFSSKITSPILDRHKSGDFLTITKNFADPSLQHNEWKPSYDVTKTTTKKPKVLQIIVPYVTNKETAFLKKNSLNKNKKPLPQNYIDMYTTLVPNFIPPSSTEVSAWASFTTIENEPTVTTEPSSTATAAHNIKRIKDRLPYDVLSLQKHINDWTQQSYSQMMAEKRKQLTGPKQIPREYISTQQSNRYVEESNIKNHRLQNNSTNSMHEHLLNKSDIHTNLISPTPTTTIIEEILTESPKKKPSEVYKSLWDVSHVTVSPQSKEKVYIVTPQAYNFYTSTPATAWSTAPKVKNGKINNGSEFDSYKFSIIVEPQDKTNGYNLKNESKNPIKIVYSEWPHLINNLQTTTRTPTSRHPLFGLMDIPAYTPPPNSTVETIFAHSRVATASTWISDTPTAKTKTTAEDF